jgi:hypothetical protein
MDSMTITQGEQVFGHDGMLWKPLPGCVSTFDELLHSQRRWMQIFNETDWDPWRAAELAPECKHAEHVMGEWTRAEPGHRPMTKRRIGAINAAITRKVRAERAADEARWERDRSRYDLERERARLALLERDSIHRSHERELAEHRSRTIYPAMPAARRAEAIAELEAKVEKDEQEIARLATVVGDREDVVDHDGKLPQDRRKWNVIGYGITRRRLVEELSASTAQLRVALEVTEDRQEKSKLSAQLYTEDRRLQVLLGVPILAAEDMCADCYTPQFQHGYGDVNEMHPCPRWPMHAARMARVWEILRSASEHARPTEPEPSRPQPLATLPGSQPIAEVIEQLTALQSEYPEGIVKRGRANRWELWPKD